ncbi:MAG: Flp family type IVb pilin [Ancalomicrobiaceae bacterium]|nr:Flp family type IVb pilin [Ancalomicrobiaceae bacterium]
MAKRLKTRLAAGFKAICADDSGATALEYALIGVMVSVAIITGLTLLGSTVNQSWNYISNTVSSAMNR